MPSPRRIAWIVALCLLPAGAPQAATGAKTADRSAAAACKAKRKPAPRRHCLRRARAAFHYTAGRGVARLPAPRLLGAGAAGGEAAAVPAPVPAAAAAAGGPAAPAAPVASTLGVEAHDFGTFVLRLTRTSVPAGNLTIYFRNHDSSEHNLWLAPPAPATGATQISATVGRDGGATKTVAVTPGGWRLFCAIDGHESMTRTLTVS